MRTLALAAVAAAAVLGWPRAPMAEAGGGAARVPSEVAEHGASRDEQLGGQQRLNSWLTDQVPPGVVESALSARLTASERRQLEQMDDEGRLRVGIVKRIGQSVTFSAADASALSATPRRVAGGVLYATEDGGVAWTTAVRSNGATGLRLHFSGVALPPGTALYVFGENGEAFGPYIGRGPEGTGEFWSNTILDDVAMVVLRSAGGGGRATLPATALVLADAGVIGPRFLAGLAPVAASHCSENAACVENATCYDATPAEAAKNAVALIQWIAGAYLYSCSGGLLADTVATSQIPYFVTANHCIGRRSEAKDAECFFQYQTDCGVTACPSPIGFPRTLGATIKSTGRGADYTLLQLHQSPPADSVFLGWNSEPVAFTEGAALYRVSHPLAKPQAFSEHRVSTTTAICGGWPRGDRIYSHDVVGTTQAGSSGAPVLNDAGEVVGQLSGACGTNVADDCDNVSNATVDGAFASYFASVAPFLAPGSAAEICDDGLDNDGDGQSDCADSDCAGDPGCTCSPLGAACTSSGQCCSGKCKGAAGRMSCR